MITLVLCFAQENAEFKISKEFIPFLDSNSDIIAVTLDDKLVRLANNKIKLIANNFNQRSLKKVGDKYFLASGHNLIEWNSSFTTWKVVNEIGDNIVDFLITGKNEYILTSKSGVWISKSDRITSEKIINFPERVALSNVSFDERLRKIYVVGFPIGSLCSDTRGNVTWTRGLRNEGDPRNDGGFGISQAGPITPLTNGDCIVLWEGGRIDRIGENGDLQWSTRLTTKNELIPNKLLVVNDLIVFGSYLNGSQGGKIYGVEISNGRISWSISLNSGVKYGPLAMIHKNAYRLVFQCRNGDGFVISDKGNLVLRYKMPKGNFPPIISGDGIISYISNGTIVPLASVP